MRCQTQDNEFLIRKSDYIKCSLRDSTVLKSLLKPINYKFVLTFALYIYIYIIQ